MAKNAPKPARRNTGTTAAAVKSVVEQGFNMKIPSFFKNTLLQSGIIFAFALLLYANTLGHGFVLDDSIVITDNMFTQQGVKGIPGILSKDTFFGFFKVEGKEALVSGGRYRPMTLVVFAFIYQMAGATPWVFHLFTILVFALTCVVLYRVLLLLLKGHESDHAALLAWVATILFAVHPIHTEVVANIKGCDEIITLLASLGSLYFLVKAFDTSKTGYSIAAAAVFFLACLSKENAATFVAIAPLTLWVFRSTDWTTAFKHSIPLFIAFLVFFIIRGSILHWNFGGAPMELMNNPYLKIEGNQWVSYSMAEKLGTIFYTLWKYVQLLFIPHPLTHDYYPRHIPQMTFGNPIALLGLATMLGLGWYAISGLKHRDPIRYGILFYLLSLSIVSNLVFPIGTNMGERFAFMPSVGFCLVAAALLVRLKNLNTILIALGIVTVLFAAKTVWRNQAWSSNEHLFFTDLENSPNSAKIRNACGGVLFDKATKETDKAKQKQLCQEAVPHLNKTLEIYPNYSDAFVSRGGAHYVLQNYDLAIADYRRAVQLAADNPKWATYLAMSLRDGGKMYGEKKGDLNTAMKYLAESWQINPKDPETARILGVANGVSGRHPEAIQWFTKAVELAPNEATYYYDLGKAYGAIGDLNKSNELINKAKQMNPTIGEQRN